MAAYVAAAVIYAAIWAAGVSALRVRTSTIIVDTAPHDGHGSSVTTTPAPHPVSEAGHP